MTTRVAAGLLGWSSQMKLKLILLDGIFAISRLGPDEIIPAWAQTGDFFSISKTLEELSVVCQMALVPPSVRCESDWKVLQVVGPLDFGLTGILASIANPLAENKVSLFAISTFDTDYVLVRQAHLPAALVALRNAGFDTTQISETV